ncbi:PaaX family transcriptional regulator [Actinosynnema mirum]|uniref:Putative transcriptional regulator, PaaX family n=1 Tax=Actinosynnema mirum (strain ATCC 29888 / DSM 43827 / JCM 3225 / NBRC 14064 / NCIMB 13271 / NRRL B-12336 / IMRU 3971 / 101) TaxID=446462 RepID=C6WIP6_ACTMD|nr:PaaX family transcriptional regulator [Actinosynnema mirum]ACU38136.1 putative transcriptional regulator, PaaX family [Actinosynnema mirum DSM 43827]
MDERITPRTVVEALLPDEGAVDLALVYDTANAVGVADQPLRLTLRRMASAGELEQSGRGRAGRVRLTDQGRERLRRDRVGLALAFAQDAGEAPWDGRWWLAAISTPERERAVRDALRRDLLAAGAAPISTGLYAGPHDLTDVVDPEARAHLVTASATGLDLRGVHDPVEITEALWPAEPIDRAYDAVEEALADDEGTPLVRRLRLAAALEAAMREDPLIPPELRARPWRPALVRGEWLERWRGLADAPVYRGWL